MSGWNIRIGDIGGTLQDYGNPTDLEFVERLNGLGYWSAYLPGLNGLPEPTRGQVVRIIWEEGEGDQQVHFEGVVADVSRQTAIEAVLLRGFDLLGVLWQASAGEIRDFESLTPHRIIQGAGAPSNLLVNAQGSLVMSYGSAADVPDKVDASNPGVGMTFRADSSRLLLNVQRFALQAQYDNTANPEALRYGLEFFARLEGAKKSVPRFYLVRRRQRAASYTPEVFHIPRDFHVARRATEGMTAAEAIKVVGSGDGQQRVESTVIGSGGIEGVLTDKTLLGILNAAGNHNGDVMARRLSEFLDPDTEVVTAATFRYVSPTRAGDDVRVTEDGRPDAVLRCFERGYSLRPRLMYYTLGRPRPSMESGFINLGGMFQGQAQTPQRVGAGASQPQVVGPTTVADGSAISLTMNFDPVFRPQLDEALQFVLIVRADDTDGSTEGKFDVQLSNSTETAVLYRNRHLIPHGIGGAMETVLYYSNEAIIRELGTGSVSQVLLKVTNRSGDARAMTVQLIKMVVA